MNIQELVSASTAISKTNVNENVIAVGVAWDENTHKMSVNYYVDGLLSDEERELCDLTVTELLAEFSDIRSADSQCLNSRDGIKQQDTLVYRR